MTALRRSMIECLQLRGVSERTQAMSVRDVRQLAEHYRTSLDLISEEALRQDFLYVKHVKQYSLRFQHRVHPCAVSPYFARTSCRVPISGGTSLSLAPKSKEYSAT
jgi:integrase/recombinase XerD